MALETSLCCLLCAEIKTSISTQSILDSSNGIKEKLLACGLWMQSFDMENMPRIVCSDCVYELIRCNRFFEQIAEAEKKLLQMCPIKSDSVMDESNFGDITDYNTFDGDDFESNDLTHFTEEVYCEPWVKTEPAPQEASPEHISDEDESRIVSTVKDMPGKTAATKSNAGSEKANSKKNSTKIALAKKTHLTKAGLKQKMEFNRDQSNSNDLSPRNCRKSIVGEKSLEAKVEFICSGDEAESLPECDICKKTFKNVEFIRIHMKKHQQPVVEKSACVCDRCGAQYETVRQLLNHLRGHKNDKIDPQCLECGKRLSDLASLKVHMRMHSAKKPFQCKLCDKGYHYRAGLRIHMNTHRGVLPFKCEFCEKGFSQRGSLNLHIRTHTGEKPYKCDFCEFAAIGASILRTHTLNEHGIDIKGKPRRKC